MHKSTKDKDGMIEFQTADGESILYPGNDVSKLGEVMEPQLKGVDDVCALAFVNEGVLLHTVRVRYNKQMMYTRVARILVALNPFQSLPIYSSQIMAEYRSTRDSMNLAPHIFGLGQDALMGLRDPDAENHMILISGESGAGKTESAKLILSFVANSVSCSGEAGIEEKILRTSPIFEAFGNAMTVRNNNSSRFGKLLEMVFSGQMKVQGCVLVNYLLETTRVCSQASGERSYHIFYQMLACRDLKDDNSMIAPYATDFINSLELKGPTDYAYLTGQQVAPGIDDVKCFAETLAAFGPLGFSEEAQCEIFSLIAGLLTLGNIEFKDNDGVAEIADRTPLERGCELLKVSADNFEKLMLSKDITVCTETTVTKLNFNQSKSVRDTLSRFIYGLLFEWLVLQMNKTLQPDAESMSQKTKSLGILDIAGFECFQNNSLEQLLINLSNEHVQKSFNDTIFKAELEDYAKEGVVLPKEITYKDNADLLLMIDGKNGMLDKLDDALAIPKCTDEAWTGVIFKELGKNERLVAPRFRDKLCFGVKHFAGEVFYNTDGFLNKNAEKRPEGIKELLCASGNKMLQELGTAIESTNPANRGQKKKVQSASATFRNSLGHLGAKMRAADKHYIRCIKPNMEKVPNKFTSTMVMEQLLFSGILEAVHIRQSGFSSRLLHQDFLTRYHCIIGVLNKDKGPIPTKGDGRVNARKLVSALRTVTMLQPAVTDGSVQVGKTKVLSSSEAYVALEAARNEARCVVATKEINDAFKEFGCTAKGALFPLFGLLSVQSLISAAGGNIEEARKRMGRAEDMQREAAELALQNDTTKVLSTIVDRYRRELEAVDKMEELRGSLEFIAIEQALARTQSLHLPKSELITELNGRVKKLQVQLPLLTAIENLVEELKDYAPDPTQDNSDTDQSIQMVLDQLHDADLKDKPANWLPELLGRDGTDAVVTMTAFDTIVVKRNDRRKAERSAQKMITQMNKWAKPANATAELTAGLEQAVAEYDVREMARFLGVLASNGADMTALAPHRVLFYQLQSEEFVREATAEEEKLVNSDNATSQNIVRLLNLIDQLQFLGGDNDLVKAARSRANLRRGESWAPPRCGAQPAARLSWAEPFDAMDNLPGRDVSSTQPRQSGLLVLLSACLPACFLLLSLLLLLLSLLFLVFLSRVAAFAAAAPTVDLVDLASSVPALSTLVTTKLAAAPLQVQHTCQLYCIGEGLCGQADVGCKKTKEFKKLVSSGIGTKWKEGTCTDHGYPVKEHDCDKINDKDVGKYVLCTWYKHKAANLV